MDVQISTTNDLEGGKALGLHLEAEVRDRLSRFAARLTRVELHLDDENGDKDRPPRQTLHRRSPPRRPHPRGHQRSRRHGRAGGLRRPRQDGDGAGTHVRQDHRPQGALRGAQAGMSRRSPRGEDGKWE